MTKRNTKEKKGSVVIPKEAWTLYMYLWSY